MVSNFPSKFKGNILTGSIKGKIEKLYKNEEDLFCIKVIDENDRKFYNLCFPKRFAVNFSFLEINVIYNLI